MHEINRYIEDRRRRDLLVGVLIGAALAIAFGLAFFAVTAGG
jgi:hypothetical protein